MRMLLIAITLAALACPALAESNLDFMRRVTVAESDRAALFGTPLDPVMIEFDATQNSYSFQIGFDVSEIFAQRVYVAATGDGPQGEALGWWQIPSDNHIVRNVIRYSAGGLTTLASYLIYKEVAGGSSGKREKPPEPDTIELTDVEEAYFFGPDLPKSVRAKRVKRIVYDQNPPVPPVDEEEDDE
jgi:hypothetical protein